jgi:hypothetical protein
MAAFYKVLSHKTIIHAITAISMAPSKPLDVITSETPPFSGPLRKVGPGSWRRVLDALAVVVAFA